MKDEITGTTKTTGRTIESPFLFAEECGLALMKHRHTGKKLWLDLDVWAGLEDSIKAGWAPRHSRAKPAES